MSFAELFCICLQNVLFFIFLTISESGIHLLLNLSCFMLLMFFILIIKQMTQFSDL